MSNLLHNKNLLHGIVASAVLGAFALTAAGCTDRADQPTTSTPPTVEQKPLAEPTATTGQSLLTHIQSVKFVYGTVQYTGTKKNAGWVELQPTTDVSGTLFCKGNTTYEKNSLNNFVATSRKPASFNGYEACADDGKFTKKDSFLGKYLQAGQNAYLTDNDSGQKMIWIYGE